jgi:hypothetical protein
MRFFWMAEIVSSKAWGWNGVTWDGHAHCCLFCPFSGVPSQFDPSGWNRNCLGMRYFFVYLKTYAVAEKI